MNIVAIAFSLFLGSALYWYLNCYNKQKKDNKYCPTCGRMLLVHEQEEKKKVDGFYKVDNKHDLRHLVKNPTTNIVVPYNSLNTWGTTVNNTLPSCTSWGGTVTFPIPPFKYSN